MKNYIERTATKKKGNAGYRVCREGTKCRYNI